MIFEGCKKRRENGGAAVLAVTFLAVAMSVMLSACGTAKTEGGSPAVSGSPTVSKDASADVSAITSAAAPDAKAEYAVYALHHKNDGAAQKLQVGVQDGLYPWGYAFDIRDQASHTSEDAPGTVFYSVEGERFRLFYHHIEESGKDVISTFITTSDTGETMRGLRYGDTVEKLLEAYDDGLLYQPEPEPVSEDLGGDFCIYDELFIYTRPEDDNCRIVFYVCDGVKERTITGIEISLGQEGAPAYAADNVTTFPVDYSSPEKYTKTDTSAEEKVYGLLHAQGPGVQPSGGSKTISTVLEAMTDFDWRLYHQLYPNDPIDLMDWLYNQKVTDEKDILCVLKATDGLDGAYSETYASIVGNIYLEDSAKFIKLASQLNNADTDNIASHLCYGLSDKKDQVITELEALRDGGNMTDNEQYVIKAILYYYDLRY